MPHLDHRFVEVPQVAQQVVTLQVKVHNVLPVEVLHAVRRLQGYVRLEPLVIDALQAGGQAGTGVSAW
jgi:hypothetical protein